jgi:hypothetical protein
LTSDRELKLEDLDRPAPPPGYGDEAIEFPLPWLPEDLALRDYFAAHALGGLLAGGSFKGSMTAETAYKIADEMLQARKA